MSPEHWFESQQILQQFISQLLDGEVSLKFAYQGSAARSHLALAHSAEYASVTRHSASELSLFDSPSGLNIGRVVDIGPGDGEHTALILLGLAERNLKIAEYVGVDFSRELLAAASNRLSRVWPSLAYRRWSFRVQDIETSTLLDVGPADGSLFIVLGNVLGNVSDMPLFLHNATAGSRTGDLMLLGVAAADPSASDQELLGPYDSDVFRAAVMEPFLAAGIDDDAVRLAMSASDGNVVGDIVFRRPVTLNVGDVMGTIRKGHSVRCFTSRRFGVDEICELVQKVGWSVVSIGRDSGGIDVLAHLP